ncbi:GntR family transcriptional regulator [Sharpea azabuensis]|uniref:GntR family transcriptional regulator n=1 Tax=Sharpea porci TaxID=2652286 RepID=A0A844FU44_9FIRM|nr:GntR family transcriptional regulator [Sharpea porci]MST88910.1 GntR family transcriptional regulator [Sharpea porci]
MKWEFKNGIPIYLQIIAQIKVMIASGELRAGSKIPPVREMAVEAGVNPNTMQRALTQLEQEGLLYTQRTAGRFVSEDENVMKELRKAMSEQYIADMFHNLEKMGMDKQEIIAAVKNYEKDKGEK